MSSFDKVNIRCGDINEAVTSRLSCLLRYFQVIEFKIWHIITVNPRICALKGSNIRTLLLDSDSGG